VTKLDDFKRELAALLDKYGASIEFVVDECSDTYGLYGERQTVHFHGDRDFHTLETGWSVSASDLRDES